MLGKEFGLKQDQLFLFLGDKSINDLVRILEVTDYDHEEDILLLISKG